jgi:hypothetical protein
MRAAVQVIVALGLVLAATAGCAQTIPANSIWENQRGSMLKITSIDGTTGALVGEYVNQAAGFACKGTPYPVTGWVEGEKIGFSVRWKNATADCKSITSWTGYLEKGLLVTDWDLAYTDSSLGHATNMRGSDIFHKK